MKYADYVAALERYREVSKQCEEEAALSAAHAPRHELRAALDKGKRLWRLDTGSVRIIGDRAYLVAGGDEAGPHIRVDFFTPPDLLRAAHAINVFTAWRSGEIDELPAELPFVPSAHLGGWHAFARIAVIAMGAATLHGARAWDDLTLADQAEYARRTEIVMLSGATTPSEAHEVYRRDRIKNNGGVPPADALGRPDALDVPFGDLPRADQTGLAVFYSTLIGLGTPAVMK